MNGIMRSQQLKLYSEKKSAKMVENSNLTFYMEPDKLTINKILDPKIEIENKESN